MLKAAIFFILLINSCVFFAQDVTTIKGFAPAYVGKQVDVLQVSDFLSLKTERIASAIVHTDSSFTVSFFLTATQQLTITSNNNKGIILASPGKTYEIYLPAKNPYEPYRPAGNFVEIAFQNLSEKDINYKVLEMDSWADDFVAQYYTKKNIESPKFALHLDTFKRDVEKYYIVDTVDAFFNYHRKFTIARLDNLTFLGNRNRFEKYDFYIKNIPMNYNSVAYMEYINVFYAQFMQHIDSKLNDKIYQGIVQASPTIINRAMAGEYTMKNNIKLREYVMIKLLSEVYYQKDYPQTTILTILDSVARFGGFKENRTIAKNIYDRLTELEIGGRAPDFLIVDNQKVIDLKRFEGKHLYLFFVDPTSSEQLKQLSLLVPLYNKYYNAVNFLMIIKNDGALNEQALTKFKNDYPWESTALASTHSIFSSYQIAVTPSYFLIDAAGYLVAAPALGPLPNGQYETIDKTFFALQKAIDSNNDR
jgi:hypothetical protein